jgi:hypothetical protein
LSRHHNEPRVFVLGKHNAADLYNAINSAFVDVSRNTSQKITRNLVVVLLVVRYGLVGVGVGVKPTSGEISLFLSLIKLRIHLRYSASVLYAISNSVG